MHVQIARALLPLEHRQNRADDRLTYLPRTVYTKRDSWRARLMKRLRAGMGR
ncbi:hypothetical protein [Pontivivens ytuae]|uniref:Uncharacterized protein n=1 Tax=Pontivivens ytuae TaxID=2789856 RepID=A0A7S9LNK5_9RHOB|nr:hypothetical protein [Pontivivens ytuae]QPH52317.1 hypothetical protein I0K15_10815 [Pontivivens ytuae]